MCVSAHREQRAADPPGPDFQAAQAIQHECLEANAGPLQEQSLPLGRLSSPTFPFLINKSSLFPFQEKQKYTNIH